MDRFRQAAHGGFALVAVVLTAALAAVVSADDASAPSGPDLGESVLILQRLPATDTAADSLAELPIAEPSPAVAEEAKSSEPEAPVALPPASDEVDKPRSDQLERVAQQADRRTRHGFELASRSAYFAARSEFIGALRLVTQGLDAEHKTNRHSRALAAGLTAMKEAEDFLPGKTRQDSESDVQAIIAMHTTPVLKNEAKDATALAGLRSYFTFAQQQFAKAVDKEVAGSMALHALGKLHAAMAEKRNGAVVAAESKAMVFYQAALLTYPKNHMAANDLGVLLARCGRYADARPMFERSLAACPQSTSWQNLAVVYRQLGQPALAEQAASRAAAARHRELARRRPSMLASDDRVQWVDSQTFAMNSMSSLVGPAGATPSPTAPAVKPLTVDRRTATASRTPVPRSSIGSSASPAAGSSAAAPSPAPNASSGWGWLSSSPSPSTRGASGRVAPTPAAAQRMSTYQR